MKRAAMFPKLKFKLMNDEGLSGTLAEVLADNILHTFDNRLIPLLCEWINDSATPPMAAENADIRHVMEIEKCSYIEALCICNVRIQSVERYERMVYTAKKKPPRSSSVS